MTNYNYHVAWSPGDDGYIATCPEFPRLSAFGETPEQALAELGQVLDAAMEIYREEGWPLPAPQPPTQFSGQFRVRLPKSLHAELSERAEREGVSLNTLVVQYLARMLGSEDTLHVERIPRRKSA